MLRNKRPLLFADGKGCYFQMNQNLLEYIYVDFALGHIKSNNSCPTPFSKRDKTSSNLCSLERLWYNALASLLQFFFRKQKMILLSYQ